RLQKQHARHERMPWKMPLEDRAFLGHGREGPQRRALPVERIDPIQHLEALEKHGPISRSGRGRPEAIDLCTEVAQNEVVLAFDLSLVDLLEPAIERHFDTEPPVDLEGDVEERQAVDLQILHDVAVRGDLLDRNVAGRSNDLVDRLERRWHEALCLVERAICSTIAT